MEIVGGRYEKMEGHCLTGQSPQWAVVPMEEEELLKIRAVLDDTLLDCMILKINHLHFFVTSVTMQQLKRPILPEDLNRYKFLVSSS